MSTAVTIVTGVSRIEKRKEVSPLLLHSIRDNFGVVCNPIAGELFRSDTRLFEIIGVWHRGGQRTSFEVKEWIFESGWRSIIEHASYPQSMFELMKSSGKHKVLLLPSIEVEGSFDIGNLVWWWPRRA